MANQLGQGGQLVQMDSQRRTVTDRSLGAGSYGTSKGSRVRNDGLH